MKTVVRSVALFAVLASQATAQPPGLIVQLGGSRPAPGERRVIHYLLTDKAAANTTPEDYWGNVTGRSSEDPTADVHGNLNGP